MSAWAAQDEWVSTPEFRRMLTWSAAGHLVVVLLLWWSPGWSSQVVLPEPVMVSIVEAPRPAAPPAPPPKQLVKEIVIPDQPRARPKPTPPKPRPKPPEPKPVPEPKAEPAPPPSAEELLARLSRSVERRDDAKPEPAPASSRGRFDPELALYKKKVHARLYAAWARSACARREVSLHRVEIAADGSIRTASLVRGSGSRTCDASGERALRKVRNFPVPPRGEVTLMVTFNPEERR